MAMAFNAVNHANFRKIGLDKRRVDQHFVAEFRVRLLSDTKHRDINGDRVQWRGVPGYPVRSSAVFQTVQSPAQTTSFQNPKPCLLE